MHNSDSYAKRLAPIVLCAALAVLCAMPVRAQEEVIITIKDETPRSSSSLSAMALIQLGWLNHLANEESVKPFSEDKLRLMAADLQMLQETLDYLVNRVIADLESENQALRKEVRQLYAAQNDGAGPAQRAPVPRPYSGIFEALRDEARDESPENARTPEEDIPEFSHVILQSWGRSPEEALQLGSGVASLKGMVVVVPEGSRREDVEDLGYRLREEYVAYDNLNIEVFDQEEAARIYAEERQNDPAHRILSVSRHRKSGRDIVLYLGDQTGQMDTEDSDAEMEQ